MQFYTLDAFFFCVCCIGTDSIMPVVVSGFQRKFFMVASSNSGRTPVKMICALQHVRVCRHTNLHCLSEPVF